MSYVGFDNPVVNGGGTPTMISRLFADRPVVGYQGLIFISQDTQVIYQWVNGAWEAIGTGTFIPGAGATNGLQILPAGIGLGGNPLTELSTNIQTDGNQFAITDTGVTKTTQFDITMAATSFFVTDINGNVIGTMTLVSAQGSLILISDPVYKTGIVMDVDYSNTFINESLITKRYSDNAFFRNARTLTGNGVNNTFTFTHGAIYTPSVVTIQANSLTSISGINFIGQNCVVNNITATTFDVTFNAALVATLALNAQSFYFVAFR